MRRRKSSKTEKAAKAVAKTMDYPQDALADVACVHVTGREELLVEGCRGILVCAADKLVFDMGAYTVGVLGRALVIRELSRDGALSVDGQLSAVTFDARGRDEC